MSAESDDLILRLRAADPANAAHDDRSHVGAAARDGDALRAARARRSGRRRIGAGAGGALALAAAVALGTTTAGTVAAKPTVGEIVAHAADASAIDPGSIVSVTTDVRVRSHGSFTQRRKTWLRVDGRGRATNVRVLVTAAHGAHVAAGVEDVFARVDGRSLLQSYDPSSDRVETTEGSVAPTLLVQAHRLLLRARAGDAEVRLLGEERLDGRRAYRLLIGAVEEPRVAGERRELVVDADTYEPLAMSVRQRGSDVTGRAFSYALDERVVAYEQLDDTAANRALLRLHGPTG